MVAINQLLAKRVEELTEALAEARENANEIAEAHKLAEATVGADDIAEYIDAVIGPAEDDEDPEEEQGEYVEESTKNQRERNKLIEGSG